MTRVVNEILSFSVILNEIDGSNAKEYKDVTFVPKLKTVEKAWGAGKGGKGLLPSVSALLDTYSNSTQN